MTTQITITLNEDVAIVKIVGTPTLQDILNTFKKITGEAPLFYRRRLWDLRDCLINFSSAELEKIAIFTSDQTGQASSKVAILTTSDLTFGLSRMLQAFSKSENNSLAVFRDEGEALQWLLPD